MDKPQFGQDYGIDENSPPDVREHWPTEFVMCPGSKRETAGVSRPALVQSPEHRIGASPYPVLFAAMALLGALTLRATYRGHVDGIVRDYPRLQSEQRIPGGTDLQQGDSGLSVGFECFRFQVVSDHDLYDDRASACLTDHQVGAGSRNDAFFSLHEGSLDGDIPRDRPAALRAWTPQAILTLTVQGVVKTPNDHGCGSIVQRLVRVGAPFKGRFVGKMPLPFRTLPRHHRQRTPEAFIWVPFQSFSDMHRPPGLTVG